MTATEQVTCVAVWQSVSCSSLVAELSDGNYRFLTDSGIVSKHGPRGDWMERMKEAKRFDGSPNTIKSIFQPQWVKMGDYTKGEPQT